VAQSEITVMAHTQYTNDEIVRIGQDRYERELRGSVEGPHKGEFLAMDIETGDYEIDREDIAAIKRIKTRRPDAVLYILRVGHPTAYRLGGGFRVSPK